jgi:DNA-binding NarL/FixJ family response regulator
MSALAARKRRVAIVDDHALVALALGPLVDSHAELEFVGHAMTVAELGALRVRPDLVVLDLHLADRSMPEANVAALGAVGAHVLAFTAGDNPYLLRRMAGTEVVGILRKSAPPGDILDTVARAAHGERVWSEEWSLSEHTAPLVSAAPLTEREQQVLTLYAAGYGAKSVARRLHISANTVNDHLRRIRIVYRDLGRPANTKVELYRRAQEDGYLGLPKT